MGNTVSVKNDFPDEIGLYLSFIEVSLNLKIERIAEIMVYGTFILFWNKDSKSEGILGFNLKLKGPEHLAPNNHSLIYTFSIFRRSSWHIVGFILPHL